MTKSEHPAKNVPGIALATKILETHRDLADDALLMMQEFDPEQADLASNSPVFTPSQALDALMILRLCAAHVAADRPVIDLAGGMLTLISTMRPAENNRLKDLFTRIAPDILTAMGADKKVLDDLQAIQPRLIRHAGVLASKGETDRVMEQIESAALSGEPVIVFTVGTQPLCRELSGSNDITFTLPPPDAPMMAALLGILHRTDLDAARLPKGIKLLGDLQLSRVFAARHKEDALAQIARLCATGRSSSQVTLDQVYGQPEAQQAFTQLVADISDWRSAGLDWRDVTSSFLMIGPPGTGKTHLASAFAGTARLPFIKTSYSDCQKAGHQGDMLRELHAAAESAIAQAPAVFFIDEIDSFYARTRPGSSSYIRGVVNGLLTLLDELNSTDGVVVIAATNDVNIVDPAVIRAGRIDRHIYVGPLDRVGVRNMLRAELSDKILSDEVCGRIADQLAGFVGADIAGMLRAARTNARSHGDEFAVRHVIAAADTIAPTPDPNLQRRIANHEAGHLLVGHIFGLPTPQRVQLNNREGSVTGRAPDLLTPDNIDGLIRADLGGMAAEQLIYGSASAGSGGTDTSDLAQATRRAVHAELSLGFGETLSWQPGTVELQHLSQRQRTRVERKLQQALAEAKDALTQHRADLDRIVDVLLRERDLDQIRIVALLKGVPTSKPRAVRLNTVTKSEDPASDGAGMTGTVLNFVPWRGNCSIRRPTYEHRQRPIGPLDGRPHGL